MTAGERCVLCGGDLCEDGRWPVTLPQGGIVRGGCLECFETQAAREWQRAVAMLWATIANGDKP